MRHLRVGRNAVRGRAQHDPGPVRVLQRAAVPGPPFLRQRHHQHLAAERGRGGQRGGPGLVLRRHDLRHHRDLRPVRARQQPDRRARRRGGRRPGRAGQRDRGPGHGGRAQGLRRLRRGRAPATGTTAPRASPPGTRPRANTRSSTARTTTAAAVSTTATPRPATTTPATVTWKLSTSATSRCGATAPATARGSWPTWRTACTPGSTPVTTPMTRPSPTGSPPP